MPQINRTQGFDYNFNLLLFTLLLLSIIGMGWLASNDDINGSRYTLFFTLTVVMLFLSFLFIKENNLKNFISAPITLDTDIAVISFIIGWSIPIIIKLIGLFVNMFSKITYHLSTTAFMIPLHTQTVNIRVFQSFTSAQSGGSPFWKWFTSVFTAGTNEEFLFGFALVVAFYMVGMFIWKMLFNESTEILGLKNTVFYLGVGFIGSISTFMYAHKLNSTYIGIMFIIAGVFRLLMDSGIYLWGLALSFTVAFHQSNNNIWFIETYGIGEWLQAVFSIEGIVIMVLFLLVLFYAFRNFDRILTKTKSYFGG